MRLLTPQKPQTKMAREFKEATEDGAKQSWANSPTGKPKIYINHNKFKEIPKQERMSEMLVGEGIHLIKDFDPRAERLYRTAISDPGVLSWLRKVMILK